jgi:hypothetical protein
MEADWCILRLGDYRAHFTGYQPAESGSREFCEDIPKAGDAIIVLDFFERELRDYEVDFRLVENWTGLGNSVAFANLGSDEEIEKHTLLYLAPQQYETGTMTIRYHFDRPGRYIGIVTARRQGQVELRSLFPFSVGVFRWQPYALAAVVLVMVGGGVSWLAMRRRVARRRRAEVARLRVVPVGFERL